MRTSSVVFFCALLTSFHAGCNGGETVETTPEPEPGLLTPPEPGQGVQYRMKTTVEAGEEHERCLFVQAPADGMFVQRDEVRFSPGSHHFLLFETEYDAIPTKNDDNVSDALRCLATAADPFNDCNPEWAGSSCLPRIRSSPAATPPISA